MEEMQKHGRMPIIKTVVALAGLLFIALLVYVVVLTMNTIKEGRYIGRPDTERDTITITGEGRVIAVPDIGEITVSIVTEGEDVTSVQEENVTKSNSLIKSLKDSGIKEEDLKTTGYNVYPRYDWVDGERVEKGFEVRQSLKVKIRDLDKAGDVITVASQNGVNEVSGLSFTIDDPEEYRQEARKEALANAQEKASELAEVAGVSLGKIVSFSERSAGGGAQPTYAKSFALDEVGLGEAVSAPEFEAGSEEVYVYATIVYEIY